jgi:hypothetical protein
MCEVWVSSCTQITGQTLRKSDSSFISPIKLADQRVILEGGWVQNIVTYLGFLWRIIMGSGLDDWIYWHFYYNYKQLRQLTINDCLRLAPFLIGPQASSLPLWRMMNDKSLLTHWTNELWPFITSRQPEYRSPSPTVPVILCYPLPWESVLNWCLANGHNIILYSLHMQPAHPSAIYISRVLCRYFTKLVTLLYPICLTCFVLWKDFSHCSDGLGLQF